MTKKKWFIILSAALLMVIAIIVSTVLIINYQEQKKEHMQESYYRQNQAFVIIDNLFVTYVSWWADELPEDVQYHSYDEIDSESYLYAYLRLYEYETGNTLTLEDVREYLSQEYNDDVTLRLSEQYPNIQAYIDFLWDFSKTKPVANGATLLRQYEASLMWGQDRLPEPYCDMKIYDLPLEQMQIVVDWSLNVSDEQRAEGYYFSWGRD